MAVSEVSTASGKSASGETRASLGSSASNQPSAHVEYAQAATKVIATAVALLALPFALQAQIIADPTAAGNLRPQILGTASGITQVNIQTPSAAVWTDAQIQSMSRQAVVKVETDVARGIGQLPAPRGDVQTTIQGVPFVVRSIGGQFYAFPGKVLP